MKQLNGIVELIKLMRDRQLKETDILLGKTLELTATASRLRASGAPNIAAISNHSKKRTTKANVSGCVRLYKDTGSKPETAKKLECTVRHVNNLLAVHEYPTLLKTMIYDNTIAPEAMRNILDAKILVRRKRLRNFRKS
jgi:hypothetical protein